jgi:tyrosyl-tRNA synthetase
MTHFKSDFLTVLHQRGFLHQATDLEALDALAAKEMITSYVGFDATADSFHIGNLMQIMLLRWLQKTGHKPIALMGGGTTKIGDPTGKDEVRKLRTDEEINANVARLQQTFAQYIAFGTHKTGAILVNNAEWLDELKYVPFLRDVGRHFSINRMLTFDSVKTRLEREQPLTFLEFNYMILQGYDFVELNRRYGCVLQTGGADQWGNIVNGVDLGRRIAKEALFGLTTTLITLPSGEKMGKSVGGAVWVNADRMSAYDYYQYWRNVDDANVGRFLKLFTELPLDEIARLEALGGTEINEAKKVLALEATSLCHGRAAAEKAAETARAAFEQGAMAEGLPTIEIGSVDILGMQVAELAVRAGLATSKGEARRLIAQGGLTINDTKPNGEHDVLDPGMIMGLDDKTLMLTAGKKRRVLIRLT